MKIAIGSDHAGFPLKEFIRRYLENRGHQVVDMGTYNTERVDYPDYAEKVGRAVAAGEFERGILVCGTGIGISIAANKVRGIRAAAVWEEYGALMSRQHNDANILALGSRVVTHERSERIVDLWLDTDFEGGRHQGRIDKISRIAAEGLASHG